MAWRDNFDDESLDTSKFGTSVAGDGAVAEASGTVNITMGAAAGNAAIIYIKDALVTSGIFSYTIRHKIDGTRNGNVWPLLLVDGTPAVAAATPFVATAKVFVGYGDSGLFIAYKDTNGTFQYWSGSAWGTTATYFTVNPAYWLDVSIIVNTNKFRISVVSRGGTKAIAETTYVNFTSLQSYTTLKPTWGEAYTDAGYITSMKSDYVIFSDGTPVQAYYNGCTAAGNDYRIFKAISFDGGLTYFRDPIATMYILAALAGESYVKDPWPAYIGGTYYLFYSAFITATSKWRIRYATSSDQVTWTDQGYITTPGGAGTYDEKGHRFPVVTYNNGTWRMFVGGQNASDLLTIGYFYDASLATLTNYASNPVITVGAGGTWDDAGLLPVGITASGVTVSLHILGLKVATSKWQGGLWTSTDWIAWTPNGGNPIIVMDVSKRTTASNALINATTLTVADSTIFANDDPIIIGDGTNVHTNRVLSKADSTHITLYYPCPTAYTAPTVWAYNAGSICIEGLDPTNFPNDALGTTFQASAVLCETISWWHYSAGTWLYDPTKTPPLPLGGVSDAASSENLKWIHNGITLNHLLAIDNLSHGDSLGAPSLTQVHNLEVANLAHAHTLDSFALAQIHLLAVQALSHTHSVARLTLSQVHKLVVQALSHSHGIDGGLALLQNTLLVIQGLAHAYEIDNVGEFPARFILTVQDILHGYSLESIRLRGFFSEMGRNYLFPQDLIDDIRPSANVTKSIRSEFSEDMFLDSGLKQLTVSDDEELSFRQEKL